MRDGMAASFLQRQSRPGRSRACIYLALLIDAQNQRMLPRIRIQADDCFQLMGKLRITTYLEGLEQMRLESVRVPDASHAGLMPTSRAMVRVDQWVALARVVCVVFLITVFTIAAGTDGVRPGHNAAIRALHCNLVNNFIP